MKDIAARIDELSPRIMKLAVSFSGGTQETPDDLYQSMIVHLLERQAADPMFAEQNDSYILDAGRKRVCWPAIRRAGVVNKYTCGEPETEGEEYEYYFDTIAGPGVNPETACENLEQALALAKTIRDQLSNREQEVLSLVVSGVSTQDIASQFGITSAAVSVYKRRAVNKLHAALL